MKEAIKERGVRLSRSPKVRFGLVGAVNTVVDLTVLNILVNFVGLPLFFANVCSTTAALLTSFFLNKKAVFQGSDSNHHQFIMFLVVTLIGIWLVQGTVLALVYEVLQKMGIHGMSAVIAAKLCGIGIGMIWNYIWYSRVVFKKAES